MCRQISLMWSLDITLDTDIVSRWGLTYVILYLYYVLCSNCKINGWIMTGIVAFDHSRIGTERKDWWMHSVRLVQNNAAEDALIYPTCLCHAMSPAFPRLCSFFIFNSVFFFSNVTVEFILIIHSMEDYWPTHKASVSLYCPLTCRLKFVSFKALSPW